MDGFIEYESLASYGHLYFNSKMANEGICNPALIVGIPVGFISAVESKNDLALTNLPYITNMGRKGGSPSAAAIINAIYKLAH